ncbi:hypothetical protein HOU40_gp103 [Lactobacillus phage Bromius]|uniref:Uncharacterized protein n=1 Tax=Lactobacillus phage Bromius TaxID=2315485 RepID=A0A3S7UPV2_9CAUD|nr:hypothetical protein HOU40_gp103 [Lactobacillus phage Bromius]AYH92339.1 hypothetical protein [Lactobacillus phage Bromius]
MKLLWMGALLVTGLSFYNPEFIIVFPIILFIDLVIGSHKDSIKLVRCLNNKQQLLSLKRLNADIEEEINTCYLDLDISKHNKGESK